MINEEEYVPVNTTLPMHDGHNIIIGDKVYRMTGVCSTGCVYTPSYMYRPNKNRILRKVIKKIIKKLKQLNRWLKY